MAVGNHLDLDVAWLFDEFLDENAVVAEAGTRFVGGPLETVAALFIVASDTHAFAATAGRGLEHDWVAKLI